MSKRQLCLAIAVVALVAVLGLSGLGAVRTSSAATQSYTLDWYVVSSGGIVSTQLDSTVGQPAIGWSIGTNQLGSGFWYGARDGHMAYLPLVLRNLP
jgi:hypothetical protein